METLKIYVRYLDLYINITNIKKILFVYIVHCITFENYITMYFVFIYYYYYDVQYHVYDPWMNKSDLI